MQSIKQWLISHKPSKRRIIQLYAALLTNANLKGFQSGQIYQGAVKSVCAPGLNCYSCPAASASCPLGALQNALSNSGTHLPYYILGILVLFGIIFGRWICGFLCPFGLIQDLLHKIKTPKIRKSPITKVLTYFKYAILVIFVVGIPLLSAFGSSSPPAFCKYICPSGTLLGAGGLLVNENNSNMLSSLGGLFTWKFCLLVIFIIGSIFIYRFFCRFFCPLGAIYGLFNCLSILGVKLEPSKCINCGKCTTTCKMDIRHVGDAECISCGECIKSCPTAAISYKGPKILLAPNAVDAVPTDAASKRTATAHIPKKTRIARVIVGILMLVLLAGTLIYYNFIDKEPMLPSTAVQDQFGQTDGKPMSEGQKCFDFSLPVYGENHTVSLQDCHDKITVLNFWYVSCDPCIQELQSEFPLIKQEYGENIEILAIHSYEEYGRNIPDFIQEVFPNSDYTFCRDLEGEVCFKTLGGNQAWPMTVVLDQEGVIVSIIHGSTTYDELKQIIDPLILA